MAATSSAVWFEPFIGTRRGSGLAIQRGLMLCAEMQAQCLGAALCSRVQAGGSVEHWPGAPPSAGAAGASRQRRSGAALNTLSTPCMQ